MYFSKFAVLFLSLFLLQSLSRAQWSHIHEFDIGACMMDMEPAGDSIIWIVGNSKITKWDIDESELYVDESWNGAFRYVSLNNDNGVICCDNSGGGDVLITNSYGNIWYEPEASFFSGFSAFEFAPSNQIVLSYSAGGFNPTIIVVDSAYENLLYEVEVVDFGEIKDMVFVDDLMGLACGTIEVEPGGSSVIKTIDGGSSWYSNPFMSGPIYDLDIFQSGISYGIGYEDRVYKSSNFGDSWGVLDYSFGVDEYDDYFDFNNIYFFDDVNGFIEAYNYYTNQTEIYSTTNGGESWNLTVGFNFFEDITDIICLSLDNCFMLTCNDMYYTNNFGGIDSSFGLIEHAGQIRISLHPNPANTSVTLNTQFNANYHLMDMTGRILLQGSVNAGSNAMDISRVPPGMYMVVASGEFGKAVATLVVQ